VCREAVLALAGAKVDCRSWSQVSCADSDDQRRKRVFVKIHINGAEVRLTGADGAG